MSEGLDMCVVELSEAKDDEECPLSLFPINMDNLDFVGGNVVVLPAYPTLKKLTLSCGHSYGALRVLYHFMVLDMRCPLCRVGVRSKLRVSCLPSNVSRLFQAQLRKRSINVSGVERMKLRVTLHTHSGCIMSIMFDLVRVASEQHVTFYLPNYECTNLTSLFTDGVCRFSVRFYFLDDGEVTVAHYEFEDFSCDLSEVDENGNRVEMRMLMNPFAIKTCKVHVPLDQVIVLE